MERSPSALPLPKKYTCWRAFEVDFALSGRGWGFLVTLAFLAIDV
jgi:hypothetical protein